MFLCIGEQILGAFDWWPASNFCMENFKMFSNLSFHLENSHYLRSKALSIIDSFYCMLRGLKIIKFMVAFINFETMSSGL